MNLFPGCSFSRRTSFFRSVYLESRREECDFFQMMAFLMKRLSFILHLDNEFMLADKNILLWKKILPLKLFTL